MKYKSSIIYSNTVDKSLSVAFYFEREYNIIMLSSNVNSAKKPDQRYKQNKRVSAEACDAAMSVSHLTDTAGGYDLPHIITHARTGLKSNSTAHMKQNLEHVLKHAKDAAKNIKKVRGKIDLIPGVAAENQRLKAARKQSYGK